MSRSEDSADHAVPKRAVERVKHSCLAWVEVGGATKIEGIARILDLSARGVGLILATSISAESVVAVELLLLGNLRLGARGVVVHATPLEDGKCRVGIRFDAPPALVDQP